MPWEMETVDPKLLLLGPGPGHHFEGNIGSNAPDGASVEGTRDGHGLHPYPSRDGGGERSSVSRFLELAYAVEQTQSRTTAGTSFDVAILESQDLGDFSGECNYDQLLTRPGDSCVLGDEAEYPDLNIIGDRSAFHTTKPSSTTQLEEQRDIIQFDDCSQLSITNLPGNPLDISTSFGSEEVASPVQMLNSRRRSAPQLETTQTTGSLKTSTLLPYRQLLPSSGNGPGSQIRWRRASHSSGPVMNSSVNFEFVDISNPTATSTHRSLNSRGVRKGPLSPEARRAANKVRQEKTVCIRCKKDRQPCVRGNDSETCFRCISLGLTPKWPQPCTKASFVDIVQSGTCNYISQRACNPHTLDGSRRIRIDLPEAFDLDQVLSQIDQQQNYFDIRVQQASGSVYVLNLEKCFQYLSKVKRETNRSEHDLRAFIDSDLLKFKDWTGCVGECDPRRDVMNLLYLWGNMPSRANYSYIPKPQRYLPKDLPERKMDVENPDDRAHIILAAQLSRIVCRKLELDAYAHLQKTLNNISSMKPEDSVKFVRELGLILLTLRWRVSWWTLLGDGGTAPDIGKERFEYRVKELCRVLYFYYCSARNKIPSWTERKSLEGVWSTYADTSLPIWDDFPTTESVEGFKAWMMKGQELIIKAGVAGKLARIGLKSA